MRGRAAVGTAYLPSEPPPARIEAHSQSDFCTHTASLGRNPMEPQQPLRAPLPPCAAHHHPPEPHRGAWPAGGGGGPAAVVAAARGAERVGARGEVGAEGELVDDARAAAAAVAVRPALRRCPDVGAHVVGRHAPVRHLGLRPPRAAPAQRAHDHVDGDGAGRHVDGLALAREGRDLAEQLRVRHVDRLARERGRAAQQLHAGLGRLDRLRAARRGAGPRRGRAEVAARDGDRVPPEVRDRGRGDGRDDGRVRVVPVCEGGLDAVEVNVEVVVGAECRGEDAAEGGLGAVGPVVRRAVVDAVAAHRVRRAVGAHHPAPAAARAGHVVCARALPHLAHAAPQPLLLPRRPPRHARRRGPRVAALRRPRPHRHQHVVFRPRHLAPVRRRPLHQHDPHPRARRHRRGRRGPEVRPLHGARIRRRRGARRAVEAAGAHDAQQLRAHGEHVPLRQRPDREARARKTQQAAGPEPRVEEQRHRVHGHHRRHSRRAVGVQLRAHHSDDRRSARWSRRRHPDDLGADEQQVAHGEARDGKRRVRAQDHLRVHRRHRCQAVGARLHAEGDGVRG
mmetsp:Transcript_60618/g.126939  ORF Transcript_60618/g.126939 Transcript_60618/m.126939 type:complete len:565 (+) Transcript_60618:510-2204(+)